MDEIFSAEGRPKGMNDAQFEKWLAYEERRGNSRRGLIALVTILTVVAATIILLAWSPWS